MTKNFCTACGTENREQSRFCSGCGKAMVLAEVTQKNTPLPATKVISPPPPPPSPQGVPASIQLENKPRSLLWTIIPVAGLLIVLAAIGMIVMQRGLPGFGGGEAEVTIFDDDEEGETATAQTDEVIEADVATATTPAVPSLESTLPPTIEVVDPVAEETPVPSATPTEDVPDILVDANGLRVYTENSAETGIRVEIRYADGSPKEGNWVAVHSQTTDVNGNSVYDRRINSGRTNQTGSVFFVMDTGEYAIELGDLLGGSWGDPFNYKVLAGNATVISLTLGELVVGVRNADEQPLEGKFTAIFAQATDINSNPAKDDRLQYQRTDNTGINRYPMIPGTYAVEIGDVLGDLWGSETGHVVESGKTTEIILTMGRIAVGIENALGEPVEGRFVEVMRQESDVQGNPSIGDRIVYGRTDERGIVEWDITAGTYSLLIADILGEPWGSETGHIVVENEETSLRLTLGRIRVGAQDPDGNPIERRFVEIFYQEADVNGNPVEGDRIGYGRTDNRGIVEWDISAGRYIVRVDGIGQVPNVQVAAGEIAYTDGVNWEIREE